MPTIQQKRNNLYLILCSIFITNAIVAEIIGVKIFSAEQTLGIAPVQIPLIGGFKFDFNLTAGVVIWPFVFITSDLINEYFGKEGVKRISYITASLIAYSFIIIYTVTLLAPANFWLDVNKTDVAGNVFNINSAFASIFRQGMNIITGSIIAFLISQLLDAAIFHHLKTITGDKKIWLRATGSTVISQFIDSFVVLYIAFYVFGNWSFMQVINVGLGNYIYKFFIAILLTPVIYFAHKLIDNYLKPVN